MVRLQTRQTSSGATTEARRSRVLEAGSSEVMARLGQSGVSIQGMVTNQSSVLPGVSPRVVARHRARLRRGLVVPRGADHG